jgi:hypothetical protein
VESGKPTRVLLGAPHAVSKGKPGACVPERALHRGGWPSGRRVGLADVRACQSPHLSTLVPAKNERRNSRELVARLEGAVGGSPAEILFIDDSDDGTPELIEQPGRSLLSAVERSASGLVDSSTPSYTGHVTAWFGDENSRRNGVFM